MKTINRRKMFVKCKCIFSLFLNLKIILRKVSQEKTHFRKVYDLTICSFATSQWRGIIFICTKITRSSKSPQASETDLSAISTKQRANSPTSFFLGSKKIYTLARELIDATEMLFCLDRCNTKNRKQSNSLYSSHTENI